MRLATRSLGLVALSAAMMMGIAPATAQLQKAPAATGTQLPETATAKPNIVVIMGDDIGMWNIGAYNRGMMAGRTPNLDKIAKDGMLFTDYYAEASCTAGRANFITGELPIRTGMTTVGQAGASVGLPAEAVTIATVLKSMATPPASSAKITLATRMSSCRPFMASTSSSGICITSMRWKTRRIQTIRKNC